MPSGAAVDAPVLGLDGILGRWFSRTNSDANLEAISVA
jgi:hypothetical protein